MFYLPLDTRKALGLGDTADSAIHATGCESRSLLAERYANPQLEKEARNNFFEGMIKRSARTEKARSWSSFLSEILCLKEKQLIYAQLQSRLMVNAAGGVMENAGLCLDRFGMPYIPGSAVKGCARRMAIQQLLEARENGSTLEALVTLLANIAQVFGWGEQEWSISETKDGRLKSDFAYAIGKEHWEVVSQAALERLRGISSFAGSVSFLQAYPVEIANANLPIRSPLIGALELDVLTCHHPNYYKGDKNKPLATDDEDPNPVVFPAIAAGHVFVFPLMPLRSCSDVLLTQARTWLAEGIATFGLGAKTAAGYGWFDSSIETHCAVVQALAHQAKEKAERTKRETEAAARKAREEIERLRRDEMKAKMASLTPEQQEDHKLTELSADQFRSLLDNFAKLSPEGQKAAIRAMRLDPANDGSRRAFWDNLKTTAQKRGGKVAQTEQAIRQLSKAMFPGKEGKMP